MLFIAITSSLGYTATYSYNADGERVLQHNSNADIFYVGNYLEKDMTNNVRTTYYYFGGQRVGMRQNNEVYWLHGDHLGSASMTTNIIGVAVSEMRYYPFGETRWVSGTLPTDKRVILAGLADLRGLWFATARERHYQQRTLVGRLEPRNQFRCCHRRGVTGALIVALRAAHFAS